MNDLPTLYQHLAALPPLNQAQTPASEAGERWGCAMSTKRRESAKRIKAPDGTVLCSCGCGNVPKAPRRTWFSDACVDQWKIKNDPGHVRRLLENRDRGICAVCGRDADGDFRTFQNARNEASRLLAKLEFSEKVRAAFLIRGVAIHSEEVLMAIWPEAYVRGKWNRERYWELHNAEITRLTGMSDPGWSRHRSTGWDADHIHEVVRGGGQCGLENYQTLCHPCHKAKSARLATERAQERRVNQNQIQSLELAGWG